MATAVPDRAAGHRPDELVQFWYGARRFLEFQSVHLGGGGLGAVDVNGTTDRQYCAVGFRGGDEGASAAGQLRLQELPAVGVGVVDLGASKWLWAGACSAAADNDDEVFGAVVDGHDSGVSSDLVHGGDRGPGVGLRVVTFHGGQGVVCLGQPADGVQVTGGGDQPDEFPGGCHRLHGVPGSLSGVVDDHRGGDLIVRAAGNQAAGHVQLAA